MTANGESRETSPPVVGSASGVPAGERDDAWVDEALRRAAARLGAAAAAPPPDDLFPRVLSTALARRSPGRPAGPRETIDELSGYRRAVDAFDRLLRSLTPAQWAAPASRYGRVRDVVAHLVAIESYLGAQLGVDGPPVDGALDHVALSAPVIAELAAHPPDEVRNRWRRQAEATLQALAALDDLASPGDWHGAPLPWRDLCVVRTFELWLHGEDIQDAIGSPLTPPSQAELTLMTDLAARLLPFGIAGTGGAQDGISARLVLTGRGGGTWVVPFTPGDSGPTTERALVVADAVEFCRIVARRTEPDALDCVVTGDADCARAVLVGASALGAD